MRRRTAVAALTLAAVVACRQPERPVISGRVESRRVTVAAEIAAKVVALHTREGAAVAKGELLVVLDDRLPRARRDEADAQVREAAARLAELEAGARPQELADAQAQVAIAEADLELAHKGARAERIAQIEASIVEVDARIKLARASKERARTLLENSVSSQAQLDQTEAELAALTAARAQHDAQLAEARAGARPEELAALEARLAQAQALLSLRHEGARPEQLAAARARVEAAQAALAAAGETLRRCELAAPCDGRVEILDFEIGELVPAGAPVLAIARSGPLRARVYAPQSALGTLRPDDRISVYVDGYPDRPIEARVERIWDQAEFTASNVQTPQDRLLLLFRVDLEVEPRDDPPLRPGTSVVIELPAAGAR